ncbi:MAG: glycerophosphodiester phosphodiesterase [Gemmatimonadaceae bacterium]
MQFIGHRGAPRDFPENTMSSFLRAIELGADAVELDVHATSDGVVVVHHDSVVRGVRRAIAATTIDELSALDVGGGERIPTLAAVLDAIAPRAFVYVEIKGEGIEVKVIDEIRRASDPSRCAIHSFDHSLVRRAQAIAPELRYGVLTEHRGDPAAQLAAAGARDYWPSHKIVDAALVSAVHHAGGRVVAWTVNTAREARHLAGLGVDALCGDDVALLRGALAAAA